MNAVSLTKCKDYDYYKTKKTIEVGIQHLGGLEKYIEKGQTVLLKLNLLMKKRPEEAVTTHPIFVKALGDILMEYGCKVIIGDSPGGPFTTRALKGIYKACGIEKIAEESGFILNYNTDEYEDNHPEGMLLKRINAIKVLQEVDAVISVSKLKTHGMALFTGAVKNLFGIIPGMLKVEYHFKMPDIKDFSNMLVDVCLYAKPVLSIMDGIVGMEGEGPSAGEPRNVGVVIASNSPYHLDVVAAQLIGINPSDIPTVKRCVERGLVKNTFDDYLLKGETIEACRVEKFKSPNIASINFFKGRVPVFLENYLTSLCQPKPIFDHNDCVGCKDCEICCPPKAITMKEKKPYADLEKCIRCFCCHELCPKKAVKIKRPKIIGRLMRM
ncbi:Uncharacterized conserved protein, DUF362 family [Natronincola peptidivorans]|uniref:Ferredoxin n=1 Tax=Natronincola peptidivorans TaxID=426128 RepID=A0A1I0DIZ7_9FIRM|nr:DUF362 domain-containing protein [Natronincola peptidivorans]SET32405.1 Uncharacterized conserved protein, DUF362 family [Natronincola peptidivorans]